MLKDAALILPHPPHPAPTKIFSRIIHAFRHAFDHTLTCERRQCLSSFALSKRPKRSSYSTGVNCRQSGCNFTKCSIISFIGYNNRRNQDVLRYHSFVQRQLSYSRFIGLFVASCNLMFRRPYQFHLMVAYKGQCLQSSGHFVFTKL